MSIQLEPNPSPIRTSSNGAYALVAQFDDSGNVESIKVDGREKVTFSKNYDLTIEVSDRQNERWDGREPDSHGLDLDYVVHCEDDCEHDTPKECYDAGGTPLVDHIWKELDSALLDAFDPPIDEFEDEPLRFKNGDGQSLRHMLKLVILTDPQYRDDDYVELRVYAAPSEEEDWEYEGPQDDEHYASLMPAILNYFQPVGFTISYCDGPSRQSGYCKSSETISIESDDIDPASPRDRMLARAELRNWLKDRGLTLMQFPTINDNPVL